MYVVCRYACALAFSVHKMNWLYALGLTAAAIIYCCFVFVLLF